MKTVLLVDDDREILEINAKYLKKEGYRVVYTSNPKAAKEAVKKAPPDCIVLDVMMPGTDGFELYEQLREITDAPVIFLTGRDSEDDKIKGLLLGADDYMTKPYSLRELAARIMVNIRRKSVNIQSDNMMEFPPLYIDEKEHKAYYNQEEINLTNKEYSLLHYLAEHPNEPVTFEDIGNNICGGYMEDDRKTIMVNASRLRKKLMEYPGLQNIIETVWSKGYRFSYDRKEK